MGLQCTDSTAQRHRVTELLMGLGSGLIQRTKCNSRKEVREVLQTLWDLATLSSFLPPGFVPEVFSRNAFLLGGKLLFIHQSPALRALLKSLPASL